MRNSGRMMGFVAAILGGVVLCAPDASAKSKYAQVAELTAGGDAKEVAVNKEISKCMIEVIEGSVIINTVVVREGGNKTPITVAARLEKGAKHEIALGGAKMVSGLRISDAGRGTYRVHVKR